MTNYMHLTKLLQIWDVDDKETERIRKESITILKSFKFQKLCKYGCD